MTATTTEALAQALEDLLMFTADNNPGQGDPDTDHPSVTAAAAALAAHRSDTQDAHTALAWLVRSAAGVDQAYMVKETADYWASVNGGTVTPLFAAPSVLAGWQPIETAPKTGATIWVVIADALRPCAGPAHWRGEWRAGTFEDWLDDEAAEKWGTYPSPTHWMPLPVPPAALGEVQP